MKYEVTYKAINKFGYLTHYLRYARDLDQAMAFAEEAVRTTKQPIERITLTPKR